MSTSSDEQHRLQKMRMPCQGVSYLDALDEEIDNAIDEDAKEIKITFKDNKLTEIYNDGNPMNSNDRNNYLTLDGRGKSKNTTKNIKGKYGIGSSKSRARLAGQGKQITTSVDGDDVYQCVIDINNLCDEQKSPAQCWTGEKSNYKPKWCNIEENKSYKQGVTKEYIGEKLEQEFKRNQVCLHIIKKNNNNIKKGLKIEVIYDEVDYILTNIYRDNKEITIDIDVYERNICLFNVNEKKMKIEINKSGKPQITSAKDYTPSSSRLTNFKLIVNYTNEYDNLFTDYSDDTGEANNGVSYLNSNFSKNYENINLENNKLIINCSNNSLECDLEENDSGIDNYISTLMFYFTSEVFVNMDDNTLCYKDIDFSVKTGDFWKRDIHKTLRIKFKFDKGIPSEYDLSQEDKNRVDLPTYLTKIIQYCVKQISDNIICKNIQKAAKEQNTPEQKIINEQKKEVQSKKKEKAESKKNKQKSKKIYQMQQY